MCRFASWRLFLPVILGLFLVYLAADVYGQGEEPATEPVSGGAVSGVKMPAESGADTNEYDKLTYEELEALLSNVEQEVKDTAMTNATLRQKHQAARIEAMNSDEKVAEVRKEIEAAKKKFRDALEASPKVKEVLDEIEGMKNLLSELGKKRQKIVRRMAVLEREKALKDAADAGNSSSADVADDAVEGKGSDND